MTIKKILIISALSLNISIHSTDYIDIEALHKSTNIPHDSIKTWVKHFVSIEEWNEPSAGYYHIFANFINQYGLKRGCEVGVATGGHCLAILQNSNVEKLYAIDPYSPDYFIEFAAKGVLDLYFLHVQARLAQFGERSEMIRLSSMDAAKLFQDNELDFVFIDADHTYEAAKEDIAAWYRKVRSGGIIGGDDYATTWPGVPKAVNEFFGALGLKLNLELATAGQFQGQPRTWWIQKP